MRAFHMTLETTGGRDCYWSGNVSDLTRIYTPDVRATCRRSLDEARRLAAADPLVLSRLDFIELGWRYTELHLAAMEAHLAFGRESTDANRATARDAWQCYVDYFDELEGTHAFAESDLPRFRGRSEKQLAPYATDLGAAEDAEPTTDEPAAALAMRGS